MTEPLVSVVIPVYKSVEVIRNSTASVLSQNYTNFELLLVVDGSPDESLQVCQELANKDDRIRVFCKENGGLCSARNYGMTHAKGKYVAFLDHDDEYLPGYLSENINLLEKYQADVVKFGHCKKTFYLDNHPVQISHFSRIAKLPGIENGEVCYSHEEIRNYYSQIKSSSKLINIWDGIYLREFLEKFSIDYEESFRYGHEDILFNLKVMRFARKVVFNTGEFYIHNYLEKSSTSAVFAPERIRNAVSCTRYEISLIDSWGNPEEQKLVCIADNLFIVLQLLCIPSNESSTRDNHKYLAYYRKNTLMIIDNTLKEIRSLARKRPLPAALLFALYMKLYDICVFMYKLYSRF